MVSGVNYFGAQFEKVKVNMTNNTDATLAAWIEPQVSTLEIDETHTFPAAGADGSPFPDCTRS